MMFLECLYEPIYVEGFFWSDKIKERFREEDEMKELGTIARLFMNSSDIICVNDFIGLMGGPPSLAHFAQNQNPHQFHYCSRCSLW